MTEQTATPVPAGAAGPARRKAPWPLAHWLATILAFIGISVAVQSAYRSLQGRYFAAIAPDLDYALKSGLICLFSLGLLLASVVCWSRGGLSDLGLGSAGAKERPWFREPWLWWGAALSSITSIVFFAAEPYSLIGAGPRYFLSVVVVGCVIAPLQEEPLFRAYLQPMMVHYTGPVAGVLVSALLFSLIHPLQPVRLMTTFLSGAIFGLQYYKTRRIVVPLATHAWSNLLPLLLGLLWAPS